MYRAIATRDSMPLLMTWKALLRSGTPLFDAHVRFPDLDLEDREDRAVEAWATARLTEMIAEARRSTK